MNYFRVYNSIIERAQVRETKDYYEEHHIIPRCMGGTNDKLNLVLLTPEEHYVVHQLLVKMYPKNKKLLYAANMMCVSSPDFKKCRNNKLYGWLKRRLSEARIGSKLTNETKNKIGNSRRGILHTTDAKNKMKRAIAERWENNFDGFVEEQRRRASNPKKKKDGYFQPKSPEHAKNISIAALKRDRHACPSCGKLITKANIKNHMKVHKHDSI